MSRTHLFSLIRPPPAGVGGPRRLYTFFWGQRVSFFCFSCLGKERKKVAERREIPFPFCHTPLFALYPRGPTFFSSLLFFVIPVHWMCIPKVLMWAGDRALFEPGLCKHVRGRHWEAGFTSVLAGGLGPGETESNYTGHLFDVAVSSSGFPHILFHLHSWLSEYYQP